MSSTRMLNLQHAGYKRKSIPVVPQESIWKTLDTRMARSQVVLVSFDFTFDAPANGVTFTISSRKGQQEEAKVELRDQIYSLG